MKPKAVLAYCREKEIKAIDLRFVDVDGFWRHITLPVSSLSEASFEEGYGHEVALHQRDTTGWFHNAVLVPQSETSYLEPFTHQPTLIFVASVQDALLRQEIPIDPRFVVSQAMAYLESSAIGDSVCVRPELQISIDRAEAHVEEFEPKPHDYLACGPEDRDFVFRCDAVHLAGESGLEIERHFCGQSASSVVALKSSRVLEVCDDLMMLRYVLTQSAAKQHLRLISEGHWIPTQWDIKREGESIFSGSSHRGLSDAGLHAIGGIVKHSGALAAITAASRYPIGASVRFPWTKTCSPSIAQSIAGVSVAANNPRTRWIEYRAIGCDANPYLSMSAILMAMIDGIQNKTSPGSALDAKGSSDLAPHCIDPSHQHSIPRSLLCSQLSSDRDFLVRGDVFSEELLDLLCESLQDN